MPLCHVAARSAPPPVTLRPASVQVPRLDADGKIVLRPASPDALTRLLRAANADDRELDTALIHLGVLPPLDLSVIRSWLTVDDIGIRASTNRDGHRIVEVMMGDRPTAWIHHDGRVVAAHETRPLAPA